MHETLVAYEALHFGHLAFMLAVSINHGGGVTDHVRSFPLRVPVLRRADSPDEGAGHFASFPSEAFQKYQLGRGGGEIDTMAFIFGSRGAISKSNDSDIEFISLSLG